MTFDTWVLKDTEELEGEKGLRAGGKPMACGGAARGPWSGRGHTWTGDLQPAHASPFVICRQTQV